MGTGFWLGVRQGNGFLDMCSGEGQGLGRTTSKVKKRRTATTVGNNETTHVGESSSNPGNVS